MPSLPLADARVNLFSSSFQSIPDQTVTLVQAMEAIRTGVYQSQMQAVRRVLARDGKRAYDRAKAHLPALTFGGLFSPCRGNAHLQHHSGLVHADLDRLANPEAMQRTLSQDPRTVYVFVSPSGTGLKLGVHVPRVVHDAAYKHAWASVAMAYERLYDVVWDPSGKDCARLCFVSVDAGLYWNPDAEVFEVSPPPIERPPRPSPSPLSMPGRGHQGYAERAIRTAVQMIQTAPMGTRHHTRLKAARLLGGYVGGGLMSEDQAYGALAQALIGHTEDLKRALQTVVDGLGYGQAHAITLEALEVERQAWLDAHRPIPHNRQGRPSHSPMKGDRQRAREWRTARVLTRQREAEETARRILERREGVTER